MPKLKTNKGAAKRFKKTAGGYKYRRAFRNHILTKKTTKTKRQLRSGGYIHASDRKAVAQMLNHE